MPITLSNEAPDGRQDVIFPFLYRTVSTSLGRADDHDPTESDIPRVRVLPAAPWSRIGARELERAGSDAAYAEADSLGSLDQPTRSIANRDVTIA